MENNTITFTVKDNKIHLDYAHPMTISDLLQALSTGILLSMRSIADSQETEQAKQQVKEDLYDMFNAAASNVLYLFAPEIEMRPDLTAEAILNAENDIIDREYKKFQKEKKKQSHLKVVK